MFGFSEQVNMEYNCNYNKTNKFNFGDSILVRIEIMPFLLAVISIYLFDISFRFAFEDVGVVGLLEFEGLLTICF